MKEKIRKQNQGITLIALVITIIILLILAAVTIAALSGDNGILSNAAKARDEQANSTIKDAIILAWNEYQIEINIPTAEVTNDEIKIASTQTVQVKGEIEKSLISADTSFIDYLREEKGYIDDEGVIDVEALTGQTFHRGNGTDGLTDVYKIEEKEGIITLTYYGNNEEDNSILWEISSGSEEASTYPEATPENKFYYNETENEVNLIGYHYANYELKKEFYDDNGNIPPELEDSSADSFYRLNPGELKTDIVIPKTINNKEVVSLTMGEAFFMQSNIRTITIPYSVREINGDFIFGNTPFLTTISFPEGKNPDLEIPDNRWGADESVQIIGKNGEILK